MTEPIGGGRGAPTGFDRAAPADIREVLAGESCFYSDIEHPADGAAVWSLTRLRDATGRIEAALALGYPASRWLGAIAGARGIVLG
ncbi:MAG: hypothetical protein EXS38_09680 [Opitutus sp.]|nr:hypothetical protein [Opitutus sp.]